LRAIKKPQATKTTYATAAEAARKLSADLQASLTAASIDASWAKETANAAIRTMPGE